MVALSRKRISADSRMWQVTGRARQITRMATDKREMRKTPFFLHPWYPRHPRFKNFTGKINTGLSCRHKPYKNIIENLTKRVDQPTTPHGSILSGLSA